MVLMSGGIHSLAPVPWSLQQHTQAKLSLAWISQQPQQFSPARNIEEKVGNLVRFNADFKKQLYLFSVSLSVDANGQFASLSIEPAPSNDSDRDLLEKIINAIKKLYNDYIPQRDPLMQPI